MSAPIQLWKFPDAPEHLRALSVAAGDEDLLLLVPASWLTDAVMDDLPLPMWDLLGGSRTCPWGHVDRFPHADGTMIVITSSS